MEKWPVLFMLLVLVASGCSTPPSSPAPRYVWYCHVAGGANCTGNLIRCWDRQRINWAEDSNCAAIEKPRNLVHNQSYPHVSGSALLPGR
jgi:hypothetical protein